jgi:membrane metallo-endopeptidase-like protein 1
MNETEWVEPPSLEVVIAKIRKIINNGILVDIWVGPDDRNSNEYILQVIRRKMGLKTVIQILPKQHVKDTLSFTE